MCAGGSGWRAADASATHAIDAVAGAMGTRVVEIRRDESLRGTTAIDAAEEEGGSTFEYGLRRAMEQIREADEDLIFAAANGEDKTGIGIELDVEARRATFAAEASVNALEERSAPGKRNTEKGAWVAMEGFGSDGVSGHG